MPNIAAVLNDQITRRAGREITARTKATRRLVAQHRRDIAALKRQMASVLKTLAFLEGQDKKRVAAPPVPQEVGGVRFQAKGLRSHRATLGLSAKDYGRLGGVSGVTIYLWESGKSKPRPAQVAKVAAVRGIGKREAQKRLEMLGASKEVKKRGAHPQTAQAFITSLVRSRRAVTTRAINAAWKKSGRSGVADNRLSFMVAHRTLKRIKVKGVKGSSFKVA